MHLSTNASTSKHMDWMEERIALRGHRLSQGSQQRENLPAGVPVLTGTGNDGITHSQQPQQCRQLHACHCTVVWVHHNPTPFFVLLTWLIVVSLYASFLPKWPSRGREACSPISLAWALSSVACVGGTRGIGVPASGGFIASSRRVRVFTLLTDECRHRQERAAEVVGVDK